MKTRVRFCCWGIVVFSVVAVGCAADEEQPPWKSPTYEWKAVAAKAGFTQEAIDRLAREKLFVSGVEAKQVFEPYTGNVLPFFITSDSLLNGFHVLFEESVMRLEHANAQRLPDILRLIMKNLPTAEGNYEGNSAVVIKARKRATTIIAVALQLEGVPVQTSDAELSKTIKSEVERVVAATAHDKPAWLGPPDPGFLALDYSRFKPRGFYTKTPILQRHFRAVSWLQAIPFRVANDEEFLAIRLLADCISLYDTNAQRKNISHRFHSSIESFLRSYRTFLGNGDDWDLLTVGSNDNDFKDEQKSLLERAARDGKGPQINDQVRLAPDESGKVAEPNFRIISAYRTPDGVLFQRTTDLRRFTRPFPTGLEVTALLGSPFARSQLASEKQPGLLKCVEDGKKLLGTEDLYSQYMNCLAALLQPPDPAAPALFGQEPWQIKSCQTVLGGWAQLRHTWILQIKPTVALMGASSPPRGFVEPVPEFYSRFATLVENTTQVLEEAGTFKPDYKMRAANLRRAANLLTAKGFAAKGENAWKTVSKGESNEVNEALEYLPVVCEGFLDLDAKPKDYAKTIAALRKLADDVDAGKVAADSDPMVRLGYVETDIAPLWPRLLKLARRLESLAHKQLRQMPFSAEEEVFVGDYGKALAGIMLYGGFTWNYPRDDAPRAVDVYFNPRLWRYLLVGVGRPRMLYLLYPWQGKEILCEGAVMPYHEFAHTQRITDAEWKNILDSTAAPPAPAWLKSIQMEKPFVPLKKKTK